MSNQDSQVVVAFDFSHSGYEALYRAIAIVKRAPSHVLHVVCVVEPRRENPAVPTNGPIDYDYTSRVHDAIVDTLRQELEAAQVTDRAHLFVHVRIGKPAEEILALARDVGADLIIIGTKGLTGVEHMLLGSVAEKVVREAGCAVVVARRKMYDNVQLLKLEEVPANHTYVPPHRYSYEDHRIEKRPTAWPLY